jgi:hypothetical protein
MTRRFSIDDETGAHNDEGSQQAGCTAETAHVGAASD